MSARPVVTWLLLLLLLGIELLLVWIGAGMATPLVGIAMAVLVALGFMRLGSGPPLARIFAIAGVFWLLVLLGLGSVDYLTRTDYPVSIGTAP